MECQACMSAMQAKVVSHDDFRELANTFKGFLASSKYSTVLLQSKQECRCSLNAYAASNTTHPAAHGPPRCSAAPVVSLSWVGKCAGGSTGAGSELQGERRGACRVSWCAGGLLDEAQYILGMSATLREGEAYPQGYEQPAPRHQAARSCCRALIHVPGSAMFWEELVQANGSRGGM